MEFERLSRRELQALCKKNKIPANITNLAMAHALSSLSTSVEGLEDVLITDQTSVDSPARTAIKQSAPRTNCRTSTRQKPISELPPQSTQISTRTRGTRRAPVASVDLVSRKMDNQLKEAAEEEREGEETPAPVAVSRRRAGTSVRQACSTRRSTRLLEKQMMGMHLDHDDDEEKVEGDEKVVKEQIINEESVVIDQEMGVEGISQQKKPCDLQEKTDSYDEVTNILPKAGLMSDYNEVDSSNIDLEQISVVLVEDRDTDESHAKIDSYDEKTNILPKASLMGDNNDVDSSNIDLQLMSEVVVEDKDTDESHAEIEEDSEKCSENFGAEHESDKSHGYSKLANAESFINGPTEESFEDTRKYEPASFDQHKIGQESNNAKDSIANLIGEEYKLENEENFALDESVVEPINKEEAELEKGMAIAVEDTIKYESASFDQYKIGQESNNAKDSIANLIGEEYKLENEENFALDESVVGPINKEEAELEKGMAIAVEDTIKYESASFDQYKIGQESNNAKDSIANLIGEEYKLENEENFALDESVVEPINKEEAELEKGMAMAVITQIAGEMSIDSAEKNDQSIFVLETETETETCLMTSDQTAVNADRKDNIFSNGEKIEKHNILDINKENFMKEKMEKVKVANKDASLRQLKKMLKQLKISDKNANNKEDNNMAKVGKTRPALQTLSSCDK